MYCYFKFLKFNLLSVGPWWLLRDNSHIEASDSLCQNDVKLQTHLPSTINVKMPNLPKIDVYNFKYKISVGNLMKLLFLSHQYINI